MDNQGHRNRFTLFRRLFLLFLLFLLIPIIGFLFIFQSMVTNELTEGKTRAGKESLELLRGYTDIIIDRAWSNALSLSMDPRLQELYDLQSSKGIGRIEYVDAVLESQKMISSLSATDESIHSVYLLNNKTGLIVTSLGETAAVSDYFDREWLDYYSRDLKQLCILPARQPIKEELDGAVYIDVNRDVSSSVITIILPLIFAPDEVLDGAVIINLLEKELFPRVSDAEEISYILMDAHGRVISTVDSPSLVKALEETMPNEILDNTGSGSLKLKVQDRTLMINYIRSAGNGLFLLKATDLNPLLEWIGNLRLLILGFSLSIFILGMLAASLIARKITTPINSTITLLEKAMNPEPANLGENELNRIQTAVTRIIEENRKIQNFLTNQESGTQNRIVFDLIRGRSDNAELLFPHSDKSTACLIIGINHFRQFSDHYSHQQQYAIKKLILEIALETVKHRTRAAGVVMEHEKIALIIQIPGESEFPRGEIQNLQELKDQLTAEILEKSKVAKEINTSISLGGIHEGLSSVRLSFLEAMEALNHRIGCRDHRFIDFSSLPKPPKKLPNIEIPVEKLLHCLEYGKKTEIPVMVNRIIEKLMDGLILNYRMVQEGLLPLVTMTTEFLRSRDLYDGESLTGRQKSLYDLIADQETQDDLRHALISYYLGIFRLFNLPGREESLTEGLISYIKAQSANPNLDLTMVADRAGLSYSHTRKIIKDTTGLSFINYLNRLRISRVKELLQDPGRSVRDVAGETGYHNEQSLSRFFKKYEGITPGEFKRRKHQNSKV